MQKFKQNFILEICISVLNFFPMANLSKGIYFLIGFNLPYKFMKKTILLCLIVFSTLLVFSQKKEKPISIIPEPLEMTRGTGYYKIPDLVTVSIPNLPELKLTKESVLGKLAATGKVNPLQSVLN
jgi:hypothetical protein